MRTHSFVQRGASMIEVLVTIVIIAFGLLGMAGLQSRLQVSEMEAYQRAQALVLLNDMGSRIATNRNQAAAYAVEVADKVKPLANCAADFAGTTSLKRDVREWCNAVQGAGETSGTTRLGAVIGGRGCVEDLGGTGQYMITIAWQGLVPLSAPPDSVDCGKDQYDLGGTTGCVADRCRRVVTTVIRIAPLI